MFEYTSTTIRLCLLIFIVMSSGAEVIVKSVHAAASQNSSSSLPRHQLMPASTFSKESDCHTSNTKAPNIVALTTTSNSAVNSTKLSSPSTSILQRVTTKNQVSEHTTICCEPISCECPDGYCQNISNLPASTVLGLPIAFTFSTRHSANILHSQITTPYRPPII